MRADSKYKILAVETRKSEEERVGEGSTGKVASELSLECPWDCHQQRLWRLVISLVICKAHFRLPGTTGSRAAVIKVGAHRQSRRTHPAWLGDLCQYLGCQGSKIYPWGQLLRSSWWSAAVYNGRSLTPSSRDSATPIVIRLLFSIV